MRHGEWARHPRGYTLVWVLASVALVSLGLAAIGPRWADRQQRERELELMRLGSLYAAAITRYRQSAPGTLKQYPATLEHLLADPRYPGTVRYLRKLHPDPLKPERPWGLVRADDGGIKGVFSQSDEQPFQRVAANRYREWLFVAKEEAKP